MMTLPYDTIIMNVHYDTIIVISYLMYNNKTLLQLYN